MNYTLFYKMIKEANSANTPTSTLPSTSVTTPHPQPAASNTNTALAPAPTSKITKDTLTANQLADKWITDKQNFYKNKADKYPQYENWTMSVSNQNKLREQAQKMLDSDRNAAWDAYNNQNDYSGSDGFRFATTQGYESLPSVQAKRKAEEAQKAQQQASMQNPMASAAVENPPQMSVDADQIVNAYEKAYYDTYNGPKSIMARTGAIRGGLRPLFPNSIPDWQLSNLGVDYYNAASPGRIGARDLPMLQRMYSEAEWNPEIQAFIQGKDDWITMRDAAKKAADMDANKQDIPPALKPYWQHLLSVNNRFPQ